MIGINDSLDYSNLGQVQLKVRKIKLATLENASKVLLAKMPSRVYNNILRRGRVGTLNLVV
jgi:hypothetical protein